MRKCKVPSSCPKPLPGTSTIPDWSRICLIKVGAVHDRQALSGSKIRQKGSCRITFKPRDRILKLLAQQTMGTAPHASSVSVPGIASRILQSL